MNLSKTKLVKINKPFDPKMPGQLNFSNNQMIALALIVIGAVLIGVAILTY